MVILNIQHLNSTASLCFKLRPVCGQKSPIPFFTVLVAENPCFSRALSGRLLPEVLYLPLINLSCVIPQALTLLTEKANLVKTVLTDSQQYCLTSFTNLTDKLPCHLLHLDLQIGVISVAVKNLIVQLPISDSHLQAKVTLHNLLREMVSSIRLLKTVSLKLV